ncbi:MAG TPA: hypothetical protein VG893_05515 [Terracidiphilus sp.]|nr:hypothetical protein [Terracidiphilus sp.]
MRAMTSSEIHDAIHQALEEVDRRLASGEIDGSGRFYAKEELVAGVGTGTPSRPAKKEETPAA